MGIAPDPRVPTSPESAEKRKGASPIHIRGVGSAGKGAPLMDGDPLAGDALVLAGAPRRARYSPNTAGNYDATQAGH